MGTDVDPVVGQWYSHLDKGQEFEIVAMDEDAGAVEIQYFDGSIEELDLEGWHDMDIESIEPPQDCTGPMDDVKGDDLGYTNDEMQSEDWTRPLGEFNVETETEERRNEIKGEPEDDWGEGYPEEEQWRGEDPGAESHV